MRLLVAIMVLVLLVIIDQFQFHGYYGSQLSQYMVRAVRSAT